MTYRQPAFMVEHHLGAITDMTNDLTVWTSTAAMSDAEKRRLIDFRQGSIAEFTATGANCGVRFDGQEIVSPEINRLVIPAGHNFDTHDMEVYTDNAMSFAFPTLKASWTQSGSGVIDETISSGGERYWLLTITDSVAETFQLGQFWLGYYDQLSSDAIVGLAFENGWQSNVVETKYPSGPALTELAVARRTFSLTVKNIDPTGTDYTTLDLVLQNGRARPFWYWPPDTEDAGPFLVTLDGDGIRRQEFAAPQQAIRYQYTFKMIETKL